MPKEPYVVKFFGTDNLDGRIPRGEHGTSAYSPVQAFTQILYRFNALYLRDRFSVEDILKRVRKGEPRVTEFSPEENPYPYGNIESDSQPTQLSLNI